MAIRRHDLNIWADRRVAVRVMSLGRCEWAALDARGYLPHGPGGRQLPYRSNGRMVRTGRRPAERRDADYRPTDCPRVYWVLATAITTRSIGSRDFSSAKCRVDRCVG